MADNARTELTPEQARDRVISLFMGVCAAPDDASVAAEADQALHDLDALLGSG
ncbi:hypothetical protein FHS39_002719 [Streptomyces olivoverticillatus]|uniref:Uncharacterized protein n=1 Tax=Streptomyces olivoverticillatus TaxID=66427 RepID=A0A7W7PLR7_9ACTN|nr:hypothetical protein [Streptomyces olivoverticillatus]MBB4893688.1 hypothetical protein [Streptomyces olivoverticillatus]